MQSESTTDTEFVNVAKPGKQTNFGVLEKKIEMDFVNFIGFLATSQADGWVVYGFTGSSAHVLCGPEEDLQENTEGLSLGGQNIILKKEALQSHRALAARPHTTSQWVENSEIVSFF